MALTNEQRITLLLLAKDHWLRAESASHAYDRALKPAKQKRDLYKNLTIASALLTALCGSAGALSGEIIVQWFTAAAGLLTSVLASFKTEHSPVEEYQKLWGCRTELDGVKQNLIIFSITLDVVEDLLKGAQPLVQFAIQIGEIIQKMPITTSESDMDKAQEAFKVAVLAQMIFRAELSTGIPTSGGKVSDVDLPEDAPDVVAAFRPRIAV